MKNLKHSLENSASFNFGVSVGTMAANIVFVCGGYYEPLIVFITSSLSFFVLGIALIATARDIE